MLDVRVRRRLGPFALDAELAVPARSVLVVVGESGSGKTTLLRLIAGLLAPEGGHIRLDGRTLAGDGAWVPPRLRPIGYVAQDYALFPHLSVRENVGFGLRAAGTRGTELRARVDRALERLGITDLARRRPHEISGGQQQRAALARALVLEPEVLLLDEPLAALDLRTRRSVRSELKGLLSELTCSTLLVTHSPTDALALGERIAVMESGRITQHGPREELLLRPRTRYVADFLGTNLFRARVSRRDPNGLTHLATEGAEVAVSDCDLEGEVFAVVDPREITVSVAPPGTGRSLVGSAQNVMKGLVLDLQPEPPSGDRVRVGVGSSPPLVAEVTRAAVESLGLASGREVTLTFKATGVRVFQ